MRKPDMRIIRKRRKTRSPFSQLSQIIVKEWASGYRQGLEDALIYARTGHWPK